jgi:hypothetical protein
MQLGRRLTPGGQGVFAAPRLSGMVLAVERPKRAMAAAIFMMENFILNFTFIKVACVKFFWEDFKNA